MRENYEKIQTPADNRRGFKTEYRYKGFWYAWDLDEAGLKRRRLLYLAAELVSIAVYLAAALQKTALNSARITAGLAALSLIPWIAELWGVFRFLTRKTPMPVSDYQEIRDFITVGSAVRVVLLVCAMAAGAVILAQAGRFTGRDLSALLGHLLSAAVSVLILVLQGRLHCSMYENDHGKPGREL